MKLQSVDQIVWPVRPLIAFKSPISPTKPLGESMEITSRIESPSRS